jgi:Ribosomal protein S21
MLQPRNFARLQRSAICADVFGVPSRRTFSIAFRKLRQSDSNSPSTMFFPTASNPGRTGFKDSPLKRSDPGEVAEMSIQSSKLSIDNFLDYEARRLPRTGKLSGRTVSCPPGKINMALSTLNRIIKENGIVEEFRNSRERLPPNEARRKLRVKRHRIRFKQGISRLATIVLRMRKKCY